MSDFKYIGQATYRKDGRGIVTGGTIYTDDINIPGLLYLRVLKSPHAHARITSIDVEAVRAYPGVRAALTYKDIDKTWVTGLPKQKYVMDQHLRYVGDAVVLCVAETEEIADAALELAQVEYEILPAVFDALEAMQPDAPQLYDEKDDFQFPGNEFPPGCFIFDHGGPPFHEIVRGTIKEGEESCAAIVEGEVRYDTFPTPLPIETPILVSRWEDDGSLTVWASSQSPHLLRTCCTLSMGGILINASAPNVGGSFGHKVTMTEQVFFTAAASRAVNNAPVKWRLTKEDHLINYDERLGTIAKARVGITKDGVINLVDGDLIVDTGFHSDLTQGISSVGLGEVQLVMAKCKNWKLHSHTIATNRTYSSAVRGFGGQEMKSVIMPLFQDAMMAIDMDPIEGFMKNVVTPGDVYTWRDGHDYTCRAVNYVPAIRSIADEFGWNESWKGWLKPTSVNGRKARGVGTSLHLNADAGEDNSTAYVRIDHLGYIFVHNGASEFGQGQRNAMAKVAADALHSKFEKVTVTPADTKTTPGDFGLEGARGTKCTESAIWNAAKDCLRQILEQASERVFKGEVPPEALEFNDGFVSIKGVEMDPVPIIAVLVDPFSTITGFGEYKEDFTTPNFFINFVEVEVDLDTGYTEVIRCGGGSDVGQVIDPVQLKMQYHGGIGSAGLDTALFEGHVLDPYTGRILTANMIDYKLRPFNQFPEFGPETMLESKFDVSPIKAIGVGEITGAAAPGAVLMAISNAIGAKIRSYPATPQEVLKALGKI